MTRVATCPQCAAQLAVPDSATKDAQANCPYCNAEFALVGAIRELRTLTVSQTRAEAPSKTEPHFASDATLPDAISDMPTLSTLFERFRDIPRSGESNEDDDEASSELAHTVVSGSSGRPRDPFDFDAGALGIERPANIVYQPDALEQSAPVIAASEPKPEEVAFVADFVTVAKAHKRRARGRGWFVRNLIGYTVVNAVGLTIVYLGLLWVKGPQGDLFGIAHRIPSFLLPKSFDEVNSEEDRTALASGEKESTEEGVEQATFVAPSESNEKPKEVAEPAPFEPPPAQPLVAAAVKDAPRYTREQLDAALVHAESARAGLLAGTLSDAAAKRTKGESYVKLCQIAETLTFLNDDASAEDPRQPATEFFADILNNANARGEVGQIAVRWIEFPDRRNGGVFFAGNLLSSKQAGSAYEAQIEVHTGETLTVLLPDAPGIQSGLVGVVGSVVENPATRIAGYTGTADRAVWSRLVFPVE